MVKISFPIKKFFNYLTKLKINLLESILFKKLIICPNFNYWACPCAKTLASGVTILSFESTSPEIILLVGVQGVLNRPLSAVIVILCKLAPRALSRVNEGGPPAKMRKASQASVCVLLGWFRTLADGLGAASRFAWP